MECIGSIISPKQEVSCQPNQDMTPSTIYTIATLLKLSYHRDVDILKRITPNLPKSLLRPSQGGLFKRSLYYRFRLRYYII